MLRHALGGAVIFISLQHFILLYLTYCPALKPEIQGIAIRTVSQVGQNKVLLIRPIFACMFDDYLWKSLKNSLLPYLIKWIQEG